MDGVLEFLSVCEAIRRTVGGESWSGLNHSRFRKSRLPPTCSLLHAPVHGPGRRGNSLLKTTFKVLRRVSLCPWRIGAITAAALFLLDHQRGRTT